MSEFQKYIDQTIGYIPVFFLRLLPKKTKPLLKKARILVIKNKALGDSIYLLPTLKNFSESYNTKVDILCDNSNKRVFLGQDFIGECIPLTAKNVLRLKNNYDLVIDAEPWANVSAIIAWWAGKQTAGFNNQFRSKIYTNAITYDKSKHIVQTYLDFFRLFKKNPKADLPSLKYSNESLKKAKNKIKAKKIIGFAIGVSGNAKTRMWSTNRWIELAKKINKEFPKHTVVLFGVQDDYQKAEKIRKKAKAINMHGQTSVEEFFAGVTLCDAFVGVDSGPIHVAAAQKVPTIGLFGPNTPTIWGPYGKNNVGIWHKNKGVPSIDNTSPWFAKPSDYERQAMEDITVQEVFNNVKKVIGKQQ